MKEAVKSEREYWLPVMQRLELTAMNDDRDDPDLVWIRAEIKGLRRKLGLYRAGDELAAMNRVRVARYQAKKATQAAIVAAGEVVTVEGAAAGPDQDQAPAGFVRP
jgi:hypothetical protein